MDHEHFKLLLVYQSKKHVKHELMEASEDLDIARVSVWSVSRTTKCEENFPKLLWTFQWDIIEHVVMYCVYSVFI